MTTAELVAQSNKIEKITRLPKEEEIGVFKWFLELNRISIKDLESFVNTYEPGVLLRDQLGMDVRIGNHLAPRGGPEIRTDLVRLLERCNSSKQAGYLARHGFAAGSLSFRTHLEYERLHPFMDCNGRSGRMLWYWMMRKQFVARELGFLHVFYYQTCKHGGE